jgi:hypothetical protein
MVDDVNERRSQAGFERMREWLRAPHRWVRGETPAQRGERYAPVFIVGSGRCGSTLLRRVLHSGGALHIPPEMPALRQVIRSFLRMRDLPWDVLVRRALARFEYHPDFGVFEMPTRPIALELLELPAESRSLARILDSIYRGHGEVHGTSARRWADKTPRNVYAMREIYRVFPDAKFIVLVRDGVDVVHSMVRKGGNEQSLDAAAHRWTSSIEAARDFACSVPDACLDVRYEALVESPAATVRALCAFIDIEYDSSMLDALDTAETMTDVQALAHHAEVNRPISARHVGKGRRALTAHECRLLDALIGPTLEALGYPRAIDGSSP